MHLANIAFTSFITFVVILNPPGTAVVFAAMGSTMTEAHQRSAARVAALMAGMILLVFAVLGEVCLTALGISLPAFHVAGGLLLFLLATKMVFGRQSGGHGVRDNDEFDSEDISVFPLAFPLIAGPGAMTSVILLMGRAEGNLIQSLVVVAALLAALAIVFLFLSNANLVVRVLGKTGSNLVARVMGIILAALAVQFIVDGTRDVLTAWRVIG